MSQLNFQIIQPRELEFNKVFDTPDLSLKKRDLLLRLRNFNNQSVLTLKKPVSSELELPGYKSREEIETVVSDYKALDSILLGLGFQVCFIYEKYREVYQFGETKVMIDETPIGNFLEIEADQNSIDKTASDLGFGERDYITDTYFTLFRKLHPIGFMLFR